MTEPQRVFPRILGIISVSVLPQLAPNGILLGEQALRIYLVFFVWIGKIFLEISGLPVCLFQSPNGLRGNVVGESLLAMARRVFLGHLIDKTLIFAELSAYFYGPAECEWPSRGLTGNRLLPSDDKNFSLLAEGIIFTPNENLRHCCSADFFSFFCLICFLYSRKYLR